MWCPIQCKIKFRHCMHHKIIRAYKNVLVTSSRGTTEICNYGNSVEGKAFIGESGRLKTIVPKSLHQLGSSFSQQFKPFQLPKLNCFSAASRTAVHVVILRKTQWFPTTHLSGRARLPACSCRRQFVKWRVKAQFAGSIKSAEKEKGKY